MGKYKKIRVQEKVCRIDESRFTGEFPGFYNDLEVYLLDEMGQEKSPNTDYSNARYFIDTEYYGYDGGVEFYLYCERDENDEEYEKRVKELKKKKVKEKIIKENKKAEEIALLKKLKNKYPDAV